MTTYILIDAMNLYHRAKHSTMGDLDTKIGMSLHIIFNSIRKVYKEHGGTHVVFCTEGKSWRKSYSSEYKANRAVARLKLSKKELEEEEIFLEAFNSLAEFFLDKTNATVLHCPVAEADDMIAMWTQLHSDDNHVVVSSDTDFIQLVSPNVKIYNGINDLVYSHDGVFDNKGKKLSFEIKSDGKLKVGEPNEAFVPDSDWIDKSLFIKCIRGDKSDNVFPAYPGARLKGTKNKTGILEAYQDKNNGGYNWNNFMLQTWTDVDGNVRTVKSEYEKNVHLIDLTQQPEEYKEQFVQSILTEVNKDRVSNVGIHFLRFCNQWGLQQISKYPDDFATLLNAPYNGYLAESS